jgi:hypothetical protein
MAKAPRRNQPAISSARAGALPFQISLACWVDLLGYGRMIGAAGLNPVAEQAKEAISRLRAFHRIVAEHSGRHFRTLVLNDGAVAYRDLSMRTNAVTHDFLSRSFALFEAIAASEARNDWPGPRMVLSAGLRGRGSRRAIDGSARQVDIILRRLADGELDPQQAVREAASIQRYSDLVPQLQANFAFTKAYVAESSGSAAGLGGSHCFVDTALFIEGQPPAWIDAGPVIEFAEPRLSIACGFVPITAMRAPNGGPGEIPGLGDGLLIGERIAPDLAIRNLIRTMKADRPH